MDYLLANYLSSFVEKYNITSLCIGVGKESITRMAHRHIFVHKSIEKWNHQHLMNILCWSAWTCIAIFWYKQVYNVIHRWRRIYQTFTLPGTFVSPTGVRTRSTGFRWGCGRKHDRWDSTRHIACPPATRATAKRSTRWTFASRCSRMSPSFLDSRSSSWGSSMDKAWVRIMKSYCGQRREGSTLRYERWIQNSFKCILVVVHKWCHTLRDEGNDFVKTVLLKKTGQEGRRPSHIYKYAWRHLFLLGCDAWGSHARSHPHRRNWPWRNFRKSYPQPGGHFTKSILQPVFIYRKASAFFLEKMY